MIYFDSDYMSGAHPKVLARLTETNYEQTTGYGTDVYTSHAADLIREACEAPDARVHFLVGGTQTNATVIDGLLARHEGVMTAESGHINVHESGAIEATGHKVLTLPSHQGKVTADDVRDYLVSFYSDETYEHMVAPGMLYISFPTEYGTVYSLQELEDISNVCHDASIPLFVDGALLAKGRLLGLQFEALFIDNLRKNVSFEMWGPRGEKESTVRFVTGWSTTDDDIDCLEDMIAMSV